VITLPHILVRCEAPGRHASIQLCVGPPISTEIDVVDAMPSAFWLGAWRNLIVIVWLGPATIEIVTRVDRAIARQYDKLKQRMSSVHVVLPDVGPPDAAARTAFVEMNNRWAHAVACGAVVIERGGLVGLALRSAVTGIIIVLPKHIRVRVFDGLEQCAPWIAEQNNRVATMQLEAAEVLEVLQYARKTAK
jgi:hypothetical protein